MVLWRCESNATRKEADGGPQLELLRRLTDAGADRVGEGVSMLAIESAYDLSPGSGPWELEVKLSVSGNGGVCAGGGADLGIGRLGGASIVVSSVLE